MNGPELFVLDISRLTLGNILASIGSISLKTCQIFRCLHFANTAAILEINISPFQCQYSHFIANSSNVNLVFNQYWYFIGNIEK